MIVNKKSDCVQTLCNQRQDEEEEVGLKGSNEI